MEFRTVATKADIAFCKELIFAFRPNLKEATYEDEIMEMIRKEAFRMVYISDEAHTKAIAFTGYRTMHTLRTGRIIYIDDLYTDPERRGTGCAGALLDYVIGEARLAGAAAVHLDSGYQLHPAHRLYLNKRFVLACNHFALELS